MATMRAVQVSRPGGPFEIVERTVPDPGPGSVRIKVQACGVCHSDSAIKEGLLQGISYPRVPGHEVIGIVDAVGAGVAGWTPGQRAGLGWNEINCLATELANFDAATLLSLVELMVTMKVPGSTVAVVVAPMAR